jgi:Domain of unknown function (DUF4157)
MSLMGPVVRDEPARPLPGPGHRANRELQRCGGRSCMSGCDGRALDPAVGEDSGTRFGHDFSRVRIHTDAMAAQPAETVRALASTAGSRIVPATQGVAGDEDEFSALKPGQDGAGTTSVGSAVGVGVGAIIGTALGGPVGAVAGAIAGGVVGAYFAGGGPATFSAGRVHQVNNLADCIVNRHPAGVTWPTLNGTQFWSAQAARTALARPTLKTSAVGGQLDVEAGRGFDATVDRLPSNKGSFDETVLAPGPWTVNTTKAAIRAMIPALNICAGAGGTSFRAYGDPTDAAMFTANRRHEDHHANDHKAAFDATIVPWANKLAAAKANGTPFHGGNAALAEAALWAAVGSTPDEVASAFFDHCQAAVIAYHSTGAGGPVGPPTNPGADAQCQNSRAHYRNPS